MSKLRVDLYARKDCLPCTYKTHGDPVTGAPCELCIDAREVLTKVRDEVSYVLNEVDITTSEDLKRRYSKDIPTVFINGKKSFKFKVDEAEFRKKVKRETIKLGITLFRERNKTSSL